MNNTEVVTLIYQELLKIIGGAAVVLATLSAFLGKVWASRIANKETQKREAAIAELRAQLDRQATEFKAKLDVATQRTVLVDRVQFEHEYDIYKQAWERLFLLQEAVLNLRPKVDYKNLNESEEERMQKRLETVRESYNGFSIIVETNKPFYPEKVYSSLVAVREKCHIEVIDYEVGYDHTNHDSWKDYWCGADNNHNAILALIDSACEAIRIRIAEVRVA